MNALERGFRWFFGGLFTPLARLLLRMGVTPNAVTIAGTIVATAAALWLYPTGHLLAGTIVLAVVVFTDSLDGNMARQRGTTSAFGSFLDSTLDRVSDAAIFAGLSIWWFTGGDDRLSGWLALVCLVLAMLISYARAKAESLGLQGKKGFAERGVRLFVVLLATLLVGFGLPQVIMPIGLAVLAAMCLVTFLQRVWSVRQEAKEKGI